MELYAFNIVRARDPLRMQGNESEKVTGKLKANQKVVLSGGSAKDVHFHERSHKIMKRCRPASFVPISIKRIIEGTIRTTGTNARGRRTITYISGCYAWMLLGSRMSAQKRRVGLREPCRPGGRCDRLIL